MVVETSSIHRRLHASLAVSTHRGMLRRFNEDAVLADPGGRLLVVCDGVGGHAGGKVASSLAIQAVTAQFEGQPSRIWADEDRVVGALRQAIFAAHDQIKKMARRVVPFGEMATTICAVAVMDDRLVIANVGDSRCSRVEKRRLQQLSIDHTLTAEKVASGEWDPDSTEAYGGRSILTRALGMDPLQIDFAIQRTARGDVYLVCTDGLSDTLTEGEIARIVRRESSAEVMAMRLVEAANRRGGFDNSSAGIIRIV